MKFLELKKMIISCPKRRRLPTFKKLSQSTLKIIMQFKTPKTKLSVYENGYVAFSQIQNGKICSTVFDIDRMKFSYIFVTGETKDIDESEFEHLDAVKILTLYAEERLMHNSNSRQEYRTHYHLDNDGNDYTAEATIPDFTDALLDIAECRITNDRLFDAITKFTEKQRTVIELYYFHCLTQQQIAEKLGISRTSVADCMHGALKKLKKIL